MDLATTMLPLALVVGLSPLPVLPVFLLLTAAQARSATTAFLCAWFATLLALVVVALALGRAALSSAADAQPTEPQVGWIQIVTGCAFLTMAAVKFVRGRIAAEPKGPPKWLVALGQYGPRKAGLLGAALAGANPKNLAMALAAGAEIAALAQGASVVAVSVVAFVLVGSIGVLTPVLIAVGLGERGPAALQRGRQWLERHMSALSIGVLLVLGCLLLAKGWPSVV